MRITRASTVCSSGMNRRFAERLGERLWYGGSPLARLMLPFAGLFWLALQLRRVAYRVGLLRTQAVGVPVVVVGNLTAGGAGKTPVVEWVVNLLRAEGLRPGIISRGYGARLGGATARVDPAASWRACGDEPILLARRTGVPVEVGVDRCAAARKLAQAGVDVIVSDDGLQHYQLPRAFEIAVIDGARGLGNGWLMPAGPLREPRSRLASVDAVLVNGTEAGLISVPDALHFTIDGNELIRLDGGSRRPLTAFAGREVWAVAGIGNPQRFAAHLRRFGLKPVLVSAGDHQVVDLDALRRTADRPILMTEKDAVKYDEVMDPDTWVLPVAVLVSADVRAKISQALTSRLRSACAGSNGSRPTD